MAGKIGEWVVGMAFGITILAYAACIFGIPVAILFFLVRLGMKVVP